ncbi:uncharacterized protein [Dysidea avara]|uniref:uncharacterized protein n=1 Tax=Dysidea avara TaxID=196820 RepID=UPI00332412AC
MIDKLQQAKANGSTLKLSYTTIAFTGSAGAGKTSFLNLLNKRKFISHHHSTGVVESEHVLTVKQAGMVESGSESKWVELDHENMLAQLNKLLSNEDTKENTTISKTISLPNLQDPSVNPDATTSKVSSKTMSLINLQSPPSSLNVKEKKCAVEDDIASAQSDWVPSLGEVWNMINLLDTGGQPEFVSLLPAVSSSISLTFIVLNMEGGIKALDEPVLVVHSEYGKQSFEPYHLGLTSLDLVKLLMASSKHSGLRTSLPIQPSHKGVESDNKYQCYVGTHADKVKATEIKEIESKLASVALELKCRKCLWEQNESVLFTVDNTTAGGDSGNDSDDSDDGSDNSWDDSRLTMDDIALRRCIEDPNAKEVRSRIQKLVEKRDVYDVPISWFILLLEIQRLSTERKVSFILYGEACYVCTQGNLCRDNNEVRSALLFFHIMGILFYYHDVPGMCKYVIVDHQWLFNKLTSLVKVSFPRSGFDHEAISQLKNEGLFTKSLILQIQLEKDIDTEYFIALLIHLKIIAPVDQEKYFMPCVLSRYSFQQPSHNVLDQCGHLQYEQLCVHFLHCPLPQGFFCCLIVEVFQNLPNNWVRPRLSTKYSHHSYSNLISFHTSDTGHSVSLIDRIGYLEVQIRHEEDMLPIHNEVREILLRALDGVCNCLQYDYKQLEIGFLCRNDKHTTENHLAIVPKFDTGVEWIYCNYGKMKLMPSHKVWFQQADKPNQPIQDVHGKTDQEVTVHANCDLSVPSNLHTIGMLDTEPEMGDLITIVIPKIKAYWEDVAFVLRFKIIDVDAIKAKHNDDPKKCCQQLFKDWLSTNKGVTPKTWPTLLAKLGKVEYLVAVIEEIKSATVTP